MKAQKLTKKGNESDNSILTQAGNIIVDPQDVMQENEISEAEPLRKKRERRISAEKSLTVKKKGRPVLNEGEKGNYLHLLLKDSQIASIIRIKTQSVLTKEQLFERRSILLSNKEAALYYWKLAYTYSFYLLKERLKADAALKNIDFDHKSISLRSVADMSGIPYHNFNKMFMGRGHMSNFEMYTTFLYQKDIIFQEVYLDAGVIERAYGFYMVVADENANMELVKKIYFH